MDIQGGTDSSVGGQDLFTIEVLGNALLSIVRVPLEMTTYYYH